MTRHPARTAAATGLAALSWGLAACAVIAGTLDIAATLTASGTRSILGEGLLIALAGLSLVASGLWKTAFDAMLVIVGLELASIVFRLLHPFAAEFPETPLWTGAIWMLIWIAVIGLGDALAGRDRAMFPIGLAATVATWSLSWASFGDAHPSVVGPALVGLWVAIWLWSIRRKRRRQGHDRLLTLASR